MNEKEVLAIFGCQSITELAEKKELTLFSLKQKIIQKPFHPKLFKKYISEVQRFKETCSYRLLEPVLADSTNSNTGLNAVSPELLIESFLKEKQRLLLMISGAVDFKQLEDACNSYMHLNTSWIFKWSQLMPSDHLKSPTSINQIEDMEWVAIKRLIQIEGIKNWEELFMNKVSTKLQSALRDIRNHINYLGI